MKFYARCETGTGGILLAKSKFQGDWVFEGIASRKSPVLTRVAKEGNKKLPSGEDASNVSGFDAGHKLLDSSNEFY
jgi:hypothetical protein